MHHKRGLRAPFSFSPDALKMHSICANSGASSLIRSGLHYTVASCLTTLR